MTEPLTDHDANLALAGMQMGCRAAILGAGDDQIALDALVATTTDLAGDGAVVLLSYAVSHLANLLGGVLPIVEASGIGLTEHLKAAARGEDVQPVFDRGALARFILGASARQASPVTQNRSDRRAAKRRRGR